MAKKFDGINTSPVLMNIADATAEDNSADQNVLTGDERGHKPYKDRKDDYSMAEILDALNNRNTTGKKGIELPRRTISFTVNDLDYLQIMSRRTGQTFSEFIGDLIAKSREANKELYLETKEFFAKPLDERRIN